MIAPSARGRAATGDGSDERILERSAGEPRAERLALGGGQRRVAPLLWRGEDWSEPLDCAGWKDGFALLSPCDLRGARYHGPVATPRSVAERFRLGLLLGVE